MTNRSRKVQSGNALMEYGVPAAIIMISAGVLTTIFDIQSIGGEYFMSASGGTKAELAGSSYEFKSSNVMGGSTGDGAGGFSGSMGQITDVGGGVVPQMSRAELEAAYPPGAPAALTDMLVGALTVSAEAPPSTAVE